MKLLRFLFGLALLAVLGLFVWSARYRYDHIVVEGDTYVVRIHRVTGHADVLITGEGWVPAEDAWRDDSEETSPGWPT